MGPGPEGPKPQQSRPCPLREESLKMCAKAEPETTGKIHVLPACRMAEEEAV